MIKVFEKLISLSNNHEIIDVTRDCLVRHVSSASDKVLFMLYISWIIALKDLQLLVKGSAKTQSILPKFIETKFPTLPDTVDTLLEWDMWPTIIAALSNKYKMAFHIKILLFIASIPIDQSQKICQHVTNVLDNTQCKLQSGEITVEMLLHLKNKWDTNLGQMISALSMDQGKFLSDIQFASKRVYTFKIFLMLLKEFFSSVPISKAACC